VSQACIGANGLVEHWGKRPTTIQAGLRIFVLPAVITTAELLVSDFDFKRVNLEDGNLPQEALEDVHTVPFLGYDYPISEGIRHRWCTISEQQDLDKNLQFEFLRTVAIISASALRDFVGSFVLDEPEIAQ